MMQAAQSHPSPVRVDVVINNFNYAPYLAAATKVSRRSSGRRSTSNTASRGDLSAVRAWASKQGIEVSARGRIAKSVIDQYDASH